MKTAKIIPTSTLMVAALGLALGLAAAPALADPVDQFGCHGEHKPCGGGGDDSGGGKALLFEITDVTVCDGATATDASYGNVGWSGNILWDPNFIHVHFKLDIGRRCHHWVKRWLISSLFRCYENGSKTSALQSRAATELVRW